MLWASRVEFSLAAAPESLLIALTRVARELERRAQPLRRDSRLVPAVGELALVAAVARHSLAKQRVVRLVSQTELVLVLREQLHAP